MGTRLLEREEDLARALAMAFNADPQKRQRAIASTGARMVPNTPAPATTLTPAELPLSAMSLAEAERLKELIGVYAGNLAPISHHSACSGCRRRGWITSRFCGSVR